ncbi:HAD family hydrolase [Agromyces sp. NPDC055658]
MRWRELRRSSIASLPAPSAPQRQPDLEVRSGGSTSADITNRGIDKAHGMTRLAEQAGIPLDAMLFVGDRLDEQGNDYPVLAMGIECRAVTGWEDAVAYLRGASAVTCAASRCGSPARRIWTASTARSRRGEHPVVARQQCIVGRIRRPVF